MSVIDDLNRVRVAALDAIRAEPPTHGDKLVNALNYLPLNDRSSSYPLCDILSTRGWGIRTSASLIELHSLMSEEVTRDVLIRTYGPQGIEVVELIAKAGALTDSERVALENEDNTSTLSVAVNAVKGALRIAGRLGQATRASDTAFDVAGGNAADIADLTAVALSGRDLIGTRGFTREHYDALTLPWRRCVGAIYDGDAAVAG